MEGRRLIRARYAGLCAAAALLFSPRPAACGIFPVNAFSDDARGLTSAGFLKVPPSARFAALGGAGLALNGTDSLALNPAGTRLAAAGASASASYNSLPAGGSRAALAFSRYSSAGTFSAGLIYNGYDAGERLDAAGSGSGAGFAAYDSAYSAGWAGRYGRLDLGLALKYIRCRLDDETGSAGALDGGLAYRPPYPSVTEFALAFRNLGTPLKLGSEAAPLPFEMDAGLKWKYAPDLNLLFEGRLPADHSPYLAAAGELFLPFSAASGLSLRSGLNFRNYDDHGFMGAFAAGFGLKLGGFSLDYAFNPYGELGAAHRMTAGWAWGGAAAAAPRRPVLPPGRPLAAVAPFYAGPGVTATEAEVVRGLVESELVRTGRFTAADRSRADMVLAEKEQEYSGLSFDESAAALARRAGAALAVSGSVRRDGEGYLITVRLLDPAGGGLIAAETARAGGDYLFREASRAAAAALASR